MTPDPSSSLDELAAGELDAIDDRTLQRMQELYRASDPVPSGLVDRIAFGITLDALHADIAQLQRSTDLVGVRGDEVAETQTITFTSSTLTTMITVSPISADRVRIDGWIAPGDAVRVELRRPDGSEHTTADDDGRFVFVDVPRGLAQLVLRSPGGDDDRPVITPSVEL